MRAWGCRQGAELAGDYVFYFVCELHRRIHGRWGVGQKMLNLQQWLVQIGDHWQDVMLSAGNIFFCFTLIPMLRDPGRPPLLTCIPTGLALLAGGCVFATLHLWLTAFTQTITGLQWLGLAFKRIGPVPTAGKAQSIDAADRNSLRLMQLLTASCSTASNGESRSRQCKVGVAPGGLFLPRSGMPQ